MPFSYTPSPNQKKVLLDSPYKDIQCAGQGQDKNCVKRRDQILLVGEGGGEEAVEGDAARVGDG